MANPLQVLVDRPVVMSCSPLQGQQALHLENVSVDLRGVPAAVHVVHVDLAADALLLVVEELAEAGALLETQLAMHVSKMIHPQFRRNPAARHDLLHAPQHVHR